MSLQDWKNARVTPIYKDNGDINEEMIIVLYLS